MIDRTIHILSYLMKADRPVTSGQLAKALGVSDRTIKNSMPQVARSLEEHGAHLGARRHTGYWIEVIEEPSYSKFRDKMALRAMNVSMASYDHAERLLYVERRLVASPDGARIDQICEELALSRSAVRSVMKEAISFCESYHLKASSSPGKGVCVIGEEQMIRLALTELFEIHFNTFSPDSATKEYAQWIDCDFQERQDIRHIFLKVLRSSGISLRDSMTQRISMYFIIARNRNRAGFHIMLPKSWIEEIQTSPCNVLAENIYRALSNHFDGFTVDENEVAFLGILLLHNFDIASRYDLCAVVPKLYSKVQRTCTSAIRMFRDRTGLNLEDDNHRKFWEQRILPLVVGKRYGLDGCELYRDDGVRGTAKDPFCMYLGTILGDCVARILNCSMSQAEIRLLAASVQLMLVYAPLQLKPLRVLVTSAMGMDFAESTAAYLKLRFPQLVASAKAYELYEIRGLDSADYDAVITDAEYGYRYAAPMSPYTIRTIDHDLGVIYNKLLVRAFDIIDLLPSSSCMQMIKGVQFEDVHELIQTLSLLDAQHEISMSMVEEDFNLQIPAMEKSVLNHRGFLFRMIPPSEEESISWYVLEHPLAIGSEKVSSVIYARLHMSESLQQLAAYERIWSCMNAVPADWEGTSDEMEELMKKLLVSSFAMRESSQESVPPAPEC